MAYDEDLARRIREFLAGRPEALRVSERKMFGGLAFLLDGNMFCGIVRDDLMARVGLEAYEECLALPGARLMDFTGRPGRGMVFVSRQGYEGPQALAGWLTRSLTFTAGLPAKHEHAPDRKGNKRITTTPARAKRTL